MIPGVGGDPRQMAMMMKKLGIDVRDIHDVQEVRIKTATTDYVFTEATVSVMKAQGVETWQISGSPNEEHHEVKLAIDEADVTMVMEQTGASETDARQTLEETGGDLAEAIVKLADA